MCTPARTSLIQHARAGAHELDTARARRVRAGVHTRVIQHVRAGAHEFDTARARRRARGI